MSEYIASNVTEDEYYRYYCKDDNAIRFYEERKKETDDETVKLINDLNYAESENEELREQIYYAKETIEKLEMLVKRCSRMSEFKKEFESIINDSYFER